MAVRLRCGGCSLSPPCVYDAERCGTFANGQDKAAKTGQLNLITDVVGSALQQRFPGAHCAVLSAAGAGVHCPRWRYFAVRRKTTNMPVASVSAVPVTPCFIWPQSPNRVQVVPTTIPIIMRRLAAVAALGLSVGSCAGTIKEGMAKFEGLPLRTAIAKIGEPIDERTNAGRKVYIWGTLGTVNRGEKGKCQITATDGDVVTSFDYQGDELLCRRYAARLRP